MSPLLPSQDQACLSAVGTILKQQQTYQKVGTPVDVMQPVRGWVIVFLVITMLLFANTLSSGNCLLVSFSNDCLIAYNERIAQ